VASIPARAELRDLSLSADELRTHVLSILNAHRAYRAALGRRTR